jgi:hypothetical protein
LNAYHSFSFASWYNPERVQFGALRVLNDDTVAAGMGFGTHPHDNMEIITIPLEGDLAHKDSMGNTEIIRNGDVQVMSAGTEVKQFNQTKRQRTKYCKFGFSKPKKCRTALPTNYLDPEERNNKLQQILSPNAEDAGVWIHQDAWFHLGKFDKGDHNL